MYIYIYIYIYIYVPLPRLRGVCAMAVLLRIREARIGTFGGSTQTCCILCSRVSPRQRAVPAVPDWGILAVRILAKWI